MTGKGGLLGHSLLQPRGGWEHRRTRGGRDDVAEGGRVDDTEAGTHPFTCDGSWWDLPKSWRGRTHGAA